jgi:hypothetical protein
MGNSDVISDELRMKSNLNARGLDQSLSPV